jgi:hypothetical protein
VDEGQDLPERAVPVAILMRFTAAEAAVYPLAMTDPDRYERAVTAVGLEFQQLRRDCPNTDTLVERLPAAADEVAELATAAGISLAGLALDQVAEAAAALRYRELVAAAAAP